MAEHYITIHSDGEQTVVIKKSRFICSLTRVYSEEEAKQVITNTKKEHWKAAHNCSAFTIGSKGTIQRSTDDGEPSGTAGIPMLEVLKKNNLINVVAVVTRYFGGIKLGSSGLIRAYGQAVSDTLTHIGLVEGRLQQEILVSLSYSQLDKFQHFITNSVYTLKNIHYEEHVVASCLVEQTAIDSFTAQITEQLNGQVSFVKGACTYHETPLAK